MSVSVQDGWALLRDGDLAGAGEVFEAVIRTSGGSAPAEALLGLGISLSQRARFVEAIEVLQRAVKVMRGDARPLLVLADAYERLPGGGEESVGRAVKSYESAVALVPGDVRPVVNLAAALLRVNRAKEALGWARRAAEMDRGNVLAWKVLTEASWRVGTPEEQLRAAEAWAALPPGLGVTRVMQLNALAAAYHLCGEHQKAMETLGQAAALEPGNASTQLSMALMCLDQGDYERGFTLWRSRLSAAAVDALALPTGLKPAWDGKEELAGKRVFVVSEQGAGDLIQFARYVPELRRRVGREGGVVLGCSRLVAPLMRRIAGEEIEVWTEKEAPEHDVSALVLDLPLLLGVSERVEEYARPYLSAEPGRVEKFEALVKQRAGGQKGGARRRAVGLCWSGNPRQPVNFRRSFDPAMLAGMVKVRPEIAFFSLQKVAVPGTQVPHGVIDVTGELNDFADTAAFMAALDLVVTTDTSTAHLAGAMGLEAVVLLHHPSPHWVWGREGERTAWYPTVRLVRQERAGDWAGVIERVKAFLPGS